MFEYMATSCTLYIKMNDAPPLPPTIQKISKMQRLPSCIKDIIWMSLHSSDEMMPQSWSPIDTHARPIVGKPQLSVLMFHPLFMASEERLDKRQSDENYLKWQEPSWKNK